jgi:hypothetical protein
MKRHLILVLTTLLLASGLMVGCGEAATTFTYHSAQYGWSITVPDDWTVVEDENGQAVTFYPSHKQMEITVNVDSEETLNTFYSEAKSRGVDVEDMTPLELVIRAGATEQEQLGAQDQRIDWNEHAVTTFALIEAKGWKSWVKTCYIVDNGNFYIMTFKVLGYSDSEFEEYRNQINEIYKTTHIDGATVINLPEGKTIFDF